MSLSHSRGQNSIAKKERKTHTHTQWVENRFKKRKGKRQYQIRKKMETMPCCDLDGTALVQGLFSQELQQKLFWGQLELLPPLVPKSRN